MAIRLPDTYYTTTMLDGNPASTGIKQPPPQFYQGEDVVFKIYLTLDGEVLTPEKHIIEVIIKKNQYADNILWKGVLGDGLYPRLDDKDGYYLIWMPSSATSTFLPGTYLMDIKSTDKLGAGEGAKDRTVRVSQTLFNIDLSAMSPNPKLAPSSVVEVSYDPNTGITTTTYTGVELTVPKPVPTTSFVATIPLGS